MVKSKLCAKDGCEKMGVYGLRRCNDRFCCKHRSVGMIDFKHSICVRVGCEKRAVYNIMGEYPRYCKDHKFGEMVRLDKLKGGKKIKKRPISPNCAIIKSEDISSDFNKSLEIITDGIQFIFTTFVENPLFIIKALGSPEGQELMEGISSLSKNE